MINIIIILINIINSYHSCIVFFTGGSNLISYNIYSDFLSKLNNQYAIYQLSKNNINNEKLINKLDNKYSNIIFIGHSSGSTTAINNCNSKINKLILLDPVKTPYYKNNKNINFLDNILIINAEYSYKWNIFPPFIPFIPLFKITPDDLIINKNKIKIITIDNFGHSDLINNPWRDIMHYSRISLGNQDRDNITISNYHNLIKEYID